MELYEQLQEFISAWNPTYNNKYCDPKHTYSVSFPLAKGDLLHMYIKIEQ